MNDKYQIYFRASKSSHSVWNIIKTLFQTSLFWTFFLLAIPYTIHKMELSLNVPLFDFVYRQQAGCIIFVIASVLGLSSGIIMAYHGKGTPLPLNCPKCLVINGPYRYIRNPMVVAGLCQGAAVGIWIGSWSVILYALLGMFIWDKYVRPIEEADLLNRFGDGYEDYRRHVKCWIPNLSGYNKDV